MNGQQQNFGGISNGNLQRLPPPVSAAAAGAGKSTSLFSDTHFLGDFMRMLLGSAVVFLFAKSAGFIVALIVAFVLFRLGMFRFILRIVYTIARTESVAFHEALRRSDTMSEPILEKHTHADENVTLAFSCSSMQGWRRNMEDADVTMLDAGGGSFFAVFDGHCGSGVSKFCGENIFKFVSKTQAFQKGDFDTAFHEGFIAIDRHLYSCQPRERSGATAIALFLADNRIYCANAGDSRCVLCRSGKAIPLSTDHKPFLPSEQQRIQRAGFQVYNRRVHGALALSRAIGDFNFKGNDRLPWEDQAVTCVPEITVNDYLRDEDEFIVLACDGIWDCMRNDQVISFVRTRLQSAVPLTVICEALMDECLSPHPFGMGCDNMSVIIVQFKQNSSVNGSSSQPVSVASAAGTRKNTAGGSYGTA